MALQDELDQFKSNWLARVGSEVARLVDDDNAFLASLTADALQAGAAFPSVPLRDHLGRTVDLATLAKDQPLVVTFYRGGWCPYCNLELRAYQQILPDIEAAGAKLIAVSPEKPDDTLSTAEKNALTFTVLSDDGSKLADALGIRFSLSPAVRSYYERAGHDLAARNNDDRWSLPVPATYVLGRDGVIAFAHVDADYRKRLDPGRALQAVQKL